MKTYFDFNVSFSGSRPQFKISLKKEYKKSTHALRESGYPFSGVELGFYLHHLDNEELARDIWTFRKKMCDMTYAINFFYENAFMTDEEFEKAKFWLSEINLKTKNKHLEAMRSDNVRKNLSAAAKKNAHLSSERLKNLWKTDEEKLKQALFNPETKSQRIENFKKHLLNEDNHKAYLNRMRNPERIKKISAAAKKMWQSNDHEFLNRMRNNWSKKLIFHGKKMNAIEHKIASILDSLKVSWAYEPIVRFDSIFLQPDFVIQEKHVIECYGDFWHANPEIYHAESEILYSKMTVGEKRKSDEQRINLLKSHYETVTVLWEKEILNDSIKEKLEKIINGFN